VAFYRQIISIEELRAEFSNSNEGLIKRKTHMMLNRRAMAVDRCPQDDLILESFQDLISGHLAILLPLYAPTNFKETLPNYFPKSCVMMFDSWNTFKKTCL
jgi:hypothetical protein